MKTIWTDKRLAMAEELYVSGWSYTEIAGEISRVEGIRVSKNGVIGALWRMRKRKEKAARKASRRGGAPVKWTQERVEQFVQRYESGIGAKAVAREFNVDPASVYCLLWKFRQGYRGLAPVGRSDAR